MDNRVVILAGGKGTRLAPYTASFPKPLVPIGDLPILEVLMSQLANQGFRRFTLSLGHHSSLIRAYIAQRKCLCDQLEIDFVEEATPTGTAGSLANITGLEDTFLVLNGDVLTDLDCAGLVKRHKASGAALTIAGYRKKIDIDLGVLESDATGRLTGYREKPSLDLDVSMGIYVYEPSVLSLIKPNEFLDFPDLVQKLLVDGEKVQLDHSDTFWLDLGRPEDYARAQDVFARNPGRFGIS